MKIVRASGTWASASPRVCAGPTSISSTARPPTSRSSRPSKVRVGQASARCPRSRTRRRSGGTGRRPRPRRAIEPGEQRRRHLAHLVRGRRAGGHDLGAADELVAVAVVAVGVGVDDRADRRGQRRRAPSPSSIAGRELAGRTACRRAATPRRRRPARRCSSPSRRRAAGRRSTRRRPRADPCVVLTACPGILPPRPGPTMPAMRQLSGIDVSFLNMETSTAFGHVVVAEHLRPQRPRPAAPGSRRPSRSSSSASTSSPRSAAAWSRCRSVSTCRTGSRTPSSTSTSTSATTPSPRPGTPEQLGRGRVSRIVARPLDRSRPLWELYVIEGVEDGRGSRS